MVLSVSDPGGVEPEVTGIQGSRPGLNRRVRLESVFGGKSECASTEDDTDVSAMMCRNTGTADATAM